MLSKYWQLEALFTVYCINFTGLQDTLFQNDHHFSVLLFPFKLHLVASLLLKLEIETNIFSWTKQQGLMCK